MKLNFRYMTCVVMLLRSHGDQDDNSELEN